MTKPFSMIARCALAATLACGATIAQAATIAFSGNSFNFNAPPVNDGSCAASPDRPLRLRIGPANATGTSNLGAFTFTQTHCTTGAAGPFSGGEFSYFFEQGDMLSGTYSGLLSVGTTQGLLNNAIDFVVTGGTGRFLGGSGPIRGEGTVDFRNAGALQARLALVGRLNLPAVPEPSTWLSMITGFGAIGVIVRRRRRNLGGEGSGQATLA